MEFPSTCYEADFDRDLYRDGLIAFARGFEPPLFNGFHGAFIDAFSEGADHVDVRSARAGTDDESDDY